MDAAGATQLAVEAATLGVGLDVDQLEAFSRMEQELLAWNRRINLTAITNPAEIAAKHFCDSLALVPLLTGVERLLDVGSGAGFPAIPLKIVLPDLTVVTVDAVQKKTHFQRHVIRILGLTGITALHGRIESLVAGYTAGFDVVTSRAFAALADFARLGGPLLAPGGRLLAMKGPDGEAEAAAAQSTLDQLGLMVTQVNGYRLPAGYGDRTIITLRRRGER